MASERWKDRPAFTNDCKHNQRRWQINYFLGLSNLYELTRVGSYVLRVDLEDFEGARVFAEYRWAALSFWDCFWIFSYAIHFYRSIVTEQLLLFIVCGKTSSKLFMEQLCYSTAVLSTMSAISRPLAFSPRCKRGVVRSSCTNATRLYTKYRVSVPVDTTTH